MQINNPLGFGSKVGVTGNKGILWRFYSEGIGRKHLSQGTSSKTHPAVF